MATLTEVSVIARKGIKWGAVVVVVLSIIPFVFRAARLYYLKLNPPPPPQPTARYGKLPKIAFPANASEATPEYSLITIDGRLPALPNVGRVYVVGINKSRLLTLDRIKSKLRTQGFTVDPEMLDEQNYKFAYPGAPISIVSNIITGSMSYKFDWTTDKLAYTTKAVPTGDQALTQAREFLNNIGYLQEDLRSGQYKITYLVATGSAMIPTDSFYEANFARVDLWRADKDKMRVVTTGGDTSPVSVVLSRLPGIKRVIAANSQYSDTVDTSFETYPLKSVELAWSQLMKGEGYVAKKAGNKIIVRRASLAYYESNDPQDFLQPVFVFEGDGGFMGYVQAVDAKFVQ